MPKPSSCGSDTLPTKYFKSFSLKATTIRKFSHSKGMLILSSLLFHALQANNPQIDPVAAMDIAIRHDKFLKHQNAHYSYRIGNTKKRIEEYFPDKVGPTSKGNNYLNLENLKNLEDAYKRQYKDQKILGIRKRQLIEEENSLREIIQQSTFDESRVHTMIAKVEELQKKLRKGTHRYDTYFSEEKAATDKLIKSANAAIREQRQRAKNKLSEEKTNRIRQLADILKYGECNKKVIRNMSREIKASHIKLNEDLSDDTRALLRNAKKLRKLKKEVGRYIKKAEEQIEKSKTGNDYDGLIKEIDKKRYELKTLKRKIKDLRAKIGRADAFKFHEEADLDKLSDDLEESRDTLVDKKYESAKEKARNSRRKQSNKKAMRELKRVEAMKKGQYPSFVKKAFEKIQENKSRNGVNAKSRVRKSKRRTRSKGSTYQ